MGKIFDKEWDCYDCGTTLNETTKKDYLINSRKDVIIESTKLTLCAGCAKSRGKNDNRSINTAPSK